MKRVFQSIRFRLTIRYTAVFICLILIFSLSLYRFVDIRLQRLLQDETKRDLLALQEIIREEVEELSEPDSEWSSLMFRITSPGKNQIVSEGWRQAGLNGLIDSKKEASRKLRIFCYQGKHFLLKKRKFRFNGQVWFLEVAGNAESVHQTMNTLRLFLLLGIPFSLALSLLSGYYLTVIILKPIGAMASKAQEITADHLDQRLPVVNAEDEFGRLAHVFNQTFERLQLSFENLKRFTSDASHELRTPLTTMKSVGEVALRNSLTEAGYRDAIGSMLEEVERLASLVDNLLILARGDQARMHLNPESILCRLFVEKIVDDLMVLAEEKNQEIIVEVSSDLSVFADRQMLSQAVFNILDNAIKYTPVNGTIMIRCGKMNHIYTVLEISDTGTGIPEEQLSRIFERFHRVDSGRSREMGGYGLGLAIAQQAVQKNGGRIEIESKLGWGSTFKIILPSSMGG